MTRRSSWAQGSMLLTLVITLAAGAFCARLIWGYTDWYAYLFLPPLAAPFELLVILYSLLWLLLGTAAGIALSIPIPPWEIATLVKLYGGCATLSILLPVCLLRWELPLISFVLSVLLWLMICLLIPACARATPKAGWILLPGFGISTYLVYLLFGINLLY